MFIILLLVAIQFTACQKNEIRLDCCYDDIEYDSSYPVIQIPFISKNLKFANNADASGIFFILQQIEYAIRNQTCSSSQRLKPLFSELENDFSSSVDKRDNLLITKFLEQKKLNFRAANECIKDEIKESNEVLAKYLAVGISVLTDAENLASYQAQIAYSNALRVLNSEGEILLLRNISTLEDLKNFNGPFNTTVRNIINSLAEINSSSIKAFSFELLKAQETVFTELRREILDFLKSFYVKIGISFDSKAKDQLLELKMILYLSVKKSFEDCEAFINSSNNRLSDLIKELNSRLRR